MNTNFYFLFCSNSAVLILDFAWKNVDENVKHDLTLVVKDIMYKLKLMKSYENAIKKCHLLLSLIKNPWSHHVLTKILKGIASRDEGNILKYENYCI